MMGTEKDSSDPPASEYCAGYSDDVVVIRESEYPLLKGTPPLPPLYTI
jgi:hypothetical protein